jgi:ABC-type branched-subunit amino acid transport system substrate-binding protein
MNRRDLLQAGTAWAAAAALPARAETGVSDNDIVIGQTGVLSGPLGVPVKTFLAGAQLAFDEANADGGLFGRKLRLVSLDDELKPERAVANYQALLQTHKAFAFFGCVGSGTTAAAATLLRDSGAPLVGAYAVADSAREKTRGAAYYVRASYGREARALVQHLTTIGITRIGVAHLANPGGEEVRSLVASALEAQKLKLRGAAAVKTDGSNAAEATRAMLAEQPQAVIMYLGGTLAADVMKAVTAAGASAAFYGMSIVSGEVTAKVLGDKARGLAIAQVMPYPWGEVEPAVLQYRKHAAQVEVPVGYLSFEGYLSARVLTEALKRTGRDLTRPRLHAALRGLKWRLAGMDIDFSGGEYNGSRFVELVQVNQQGHYVR